MVLFPVRLVHGEDYENITVVTPRKRKFLNSEGDTLGGEKDGRSSVLRGGKVGVLGNRKRSKRGFFCLRAVYNSMIKLPCGNLYKLLMAECDLPVTVSFSYFLDHFCGGGNQTSNSRGESFCLTYSSHPYICDWAHGPV